MTLDLESIEQRATAATTGPWEYEFTSPKMGGTQWQLRTAGKPGIRMVVSEYQHGPDNAEFIAHARTDVPALVAEVERLRGIVEQVRDLCTSTDGIWMDESEVPVKVLLVTIGVDQ